jgi:uncharacterized protein (UPF0218 family)
MTKEEAIKLLVNATYSDEWQGNEDLTTAHNMAIKSLEAWDKVIEEIEGQRDFNIECDGESDLGMAIQIIKKHLGEVEE